MSRKCKDIPLILANRRSLRIKPVAKEQHQNQKRLKGNDLVDLASKKIKREPIVKIEELDAILSLKRETGDKRKEKIANDFGKNILDAHLVVPDGFLEVNQEELDLERTLLGGQSFRWSKVVSNDNDCKYFIGVFLNHVLKLWRISETRVAFKKLNLKDDEKISDLKLQLEDYFQLKYNLKDLYCEWSRRDENLAKCCQFYKGFRILRQNPTENVFSFICATNNNIKRISQMIEKLCNKFGSKLLDLESQTFHSFPSIERLIEDDVFQCLRYELGFGYRAKFISETAKQIMGLEPKKPDDYLLSLRQLEYKETCKQLMKFQGIGRKVADCICLMSMDHLNAVPCDCHIYEIVCRNYMPSLRQERKTLTDSVHDLIGNYFNSLHGPLAGWSTSVLFISELKHLKSNEKPAIGKKKGRKRE